MSFVFFSFWHCPKKETKKASPIKPISPRKPKFPAIAQGRESRPFWFSAAAGPEIGQALAPFQKRTFAFFCEFWMNFGFL
jgi:hypothetical protein